MAESVQATFHRYQPGAAEATEALPGINFLDVTEIAVTHEPVTGAPITLLRDTHYTIALPSGIADGTITAIGVWPTGDTFLVERVTARSQLIAFEPHKVPPGPVIEEGLDRLTRIAQEQDAGIARAIKVAPGEVPPTGEEVLDQLSVVIALNGPLWSSTAAAVAPGSGVASGEEFTVDNGDKTGTVYRNVSGTAVFVRDVILDPTAPAAASLIGTASGDTLQAVIDDLTARIEALEP